MKNRTMTLEQAYRYVLRRVDNNTKMLAADRMKTAKINERRMFCAWDRYDAMSHFIEIHGRALVVINPDGTCHKV